MRRRVAVLLAFVAVLLIGSAGTAFAYPNPGPVTGSFGVHDPSMIRTANGKYEVFSTGAGIPMISSSDRTAYAPAGAALPNGASWVTGYTGGSRTALWAPDISYHAGKYLLYYAASTFGSNTSAIGLATSTSGAPGTFADQGKVYSSGRGDDYNAIDPSLTVDASGKWWLVFGSWWTGIKLIQIDPSTGKRCPPTRPATAWPPRPAGSKGRTSSTTAPTTTCSTRAVCAAGA